MPSVNETYPKTDKEAMMQIPQSDLLSTGTKNRMFDNTVATCISFYDGYSYIPTRIYVRTRKWHEREVCDYSSKVKNS